MRMMSEVSNTTLKTTFISNLHDCFYHYEFFTSQISQAPENVVGYQFEPIEEADEHQEEEAAVARLQQDQVSTFKFIMHSTMRFTCLADNVTQ